MRVTIEQELTAEGHKPVELSAILDARDRGDLDRMAQNTVDQYAADNNVTAMSILETKIVLRKMPTPIGFSVPTYFIAVTTDVFRKDES